MLNWAENEVDIACKRERAGSNIKNGWDYGCACYESALKAYKSLLEDEHSGFSIGITKDILVRMIDGLPLTPIEDTPEVWVEDIFQPMDGTKEYRCKRMSSLTKIVHPDGKITYRDTRRAVGCDIHSPDNYYKFGHITKLIDEMFPIEMPYWPDGEYLVVSEECLANPNNGDFDTVGYLYVRRPDGGITDISRYFKEYNGEMVEISFEEYSERKARANDQCRR